MARILVCVCLRARRAKGPNVATHDDGGASEQHRLNQQRDKTEQSPAGSPCEGPVNGPVLDYKRHTNTRPQWRASCLSPLSPAQEDVINENLCMNDPGVNAPWGKAEWI